MVIRVPLVRLMSSKHPKPSGGKPHPDPNDAGTAENKCNVTGSIHVRGEVEVKTPVEEKEERDTAQKKQESRDKIHLVIESIGLAFVIIYAGLTGLLAYFSYGQFATMQQQLELANRPWIKVISVTGGGNGAVPTLSFRGRQTTGRIEAQLSVDLTIQNIGPAVAINTKMISSHLSQCRALEIKKRY